MNRIPKIIHQIWSGVDEPLPNHFKELSETWKRDYPTWKYEFWDNERINSFIEKYYPEYKEIYDKFPYNVQRWDAIRYLILDKIGGMYVDFDYESIKPIDELLIGKSCCFALEPQAHCFMFRMRNMFNNALMFSIPEHFFMKKIINDVFSMKSLEYDISPKRIVIYNSEDQIIANSINIPKNDCVMYTTGPWALINLYEKLEEEEKKEIYLIPARYVTPFDGYQVSLLKTGCKDNDLEDCLNEAYAVHYFFSGWRETCT